MRAVIRHLDDGGSHTGVVVVIDVIRAFTSAAYALSRGASRIILVEHIEDAFELKESHPGALLMGEDQGIKVPGFDLGNSPSLLPSSLQEKTLIQRTSAGTKGVVRAKDAGVCLAASLCVARATALFLTELNADSVTFLLTGGDEDRACAEYIIACLDGAEVSPDPFIARVTGSKAAQGFRVSDDPNFPSGDIPLCAEVDRFDFPLVVTREEGVPVISKILD